MSMIKIAVDAMGGDYAPEQQVKGAVLALEKQKDLFLYLCGDQAAVEAELAKYKFDYIFENDYNEQTIKQIIEKIKA